MTYRCKLEIFEGPLDLLLHLVKEQKMDIYDIPIAEITRQYMGYLELMQELNLELVGEYLVMAAELARIKSKILLPTPETDEEWDDGGGVDPRAELMRRLREYQRYRDAAFELRMKEHDQQQIFVRGGQIEIEQSSEDKELVEATVFDLFKAYQKILDTKSFEKDYEIEITEMSVTDRIQHIMEILNASESVTFDSLFTVLNSKQEIIVTFLAVLELMRLKLLRIQQTNHFETIRIYKAADQDTQDTILEEYHRSIDSESSDI
ncbi:MAG: segregation/condensation protein A [Nitrospina sp.]|jgi:segregation and condensation protein A|nr:segregation/condensation protein A [Nitrospina sp.]MBT3510111.1 segregation/condensation protein A [Nitrospina sp.]MBT3877356.1 segregation/condensation protein A [Nitrospina sp.]MBT4046773.1 segregation/condensation protein A [Nitrospina sp.]MBT4557505.1 segregation/condensation protein A [Nitrospina sp.]